MEKKLYYVNINDIDFDKLDIETFSDINDEDFKDLSSIVYGSIEEYVNDFNNEMSPLESEYIVRYI